MRRQIHNFDKKYISKLNRFLDRIFCSFDGANWKTWSIVQIFKFFTFISGPNILWMGGINTFKAAVNLRVKYDLRNINSFEYTHKFVLPLCNIRLVDYTRSLSYQPHECFLLVILNTLRTLFLVQIGLWKGRVLIQNCPGYSFVSTFNKNPCNHPSCSPDDFKSVLWTHIVSQNSLLNPFSSPFSICVFGYSKCILSVIM